MGHDFEFFSLVIFFLFPNLNLNFQSRTAFPFLVYSRDTRIGPKAADCIQINFSFQGFPHISRYIKSVDFSLSENNLFLGGKSLCARARKMISRRPFCVFSFWRKTRKWQRRLMVSRQSLRRINCSRLRGKIQHFGGEMPQVSSFSPCKVRT